MKVRDIIEKAIEENRSREKLLVGFAVAFVLLGTVVLAWGLANDSLVAYAGVAESVLFVAGNPFWCGGSITKMPHAMLEIPLRKAKTADEAARVPDAVSSRPLTAFRDKKRGKAMKWQFWRPKHTVGSVATQLSFQTARRVDHT